MHQGRMVSATSHPYLCTLLKVTDINYGGNKKMYSAPFHNAVMSPRWPFNWIYLDGVLPATVMHHSLMACQGRLAAFCCCTFFIATSAHYERANELCFCFNFSSCCSKSGDFNFKTSPYWAGNLIQKLILVRANKPAQMSTALYVHSALRILDLSALNVIRFALRRAHKSSGWCDFKVPSGMWAGLFKDSLKPPSEILEKTQELITMSLPTLSSPWCEGIYHIPNIFLQEWKHSTCT